MNHNKIRQFVGKTSVGFTLVFWIVAALVLNISLTSCSSLEDKPITEPLSMDERNQLIAKDVNYAFVFGILDYVEQHRNVPLTSSEKKTMSGLSYKRLNKFMSEWQSGDKKKEIEEKYEKEWNRKYDAYCNKVDSINDYWLDYIKTFNPENYVKIELVDILDKTDVFLGYVKVLLRLTPLKGSVSNVEAYFGFDGMMGRNPLNVTESFSSPITKEAWMNFNYAFDTDASKVNELPVDKLLEIYPFKTNITGVASNGKVIEYTDGYFKIPRSVRSMWEKAPARGKEWKDESEKKSKYMGVITELIDPDMEYEIDYVHERFKRDAYEDDSLAASFYYQIAGQY